jgi:mRNA interferase MazF
VRGDVHELRAPRGTRGNEQSGARYAVVLQSDDLMLSTVLVAPTSRSAVSRSFRPSIVVGEERTHVLVEQTTAIAPERMGDLVGHVSRRELEEIDEALRLVFELH